MRSRLQLVSLEGREVPSVSLAAIPNQELPTNVPLYLPVTVSNTPSGPVTTTVTSSNPNATAEVVQGGRSVVFTVSGTDASNTPFTGTMTLRLFEDAAPLATAQIVNLVSDGFYVGKLFHRVVPNFVIQGGSPNGDGVGGSPRPDFSDEFNRAYTFASNGLLAEANSGDDTNNSQFFVTDLGLPLAGRPQNLNFNHTIFGILTAGFDTYAKIRNTPLNGERPTNPVTITAAAIVTDTANAVVKVTPKPGFAAADSTTLVVTANDGSPTPAVSTAVLTGTANVVNNRPFLGPLVNRTSVAGASVSFSLPSTDTEGDSLTFKVLDAGFAGAPANVTVSLNPATGITTLTPAAGFYGTISLKAGVRDNVDRSPRRSGLESPDNFDTQLFTLTVVAKVTLTVDVVNPAPGENVTLTAAASGPTDLAGSVVFLNGVTILSTVPVTAGSASFTTSFPTAGQQSLTARFTPTNTAVGNGTSDPVVVTVLAPVPPVTPPVIPPVTPPVTPPVVPPVTPPVTPPTTPPVTPPVAPSPLVAVGAEPGTTPIVKVLNADGTVKFQFFAYEPTFTGGVRTAVADVTGDGVADIVTVPGDGGSGLIKVFSGADGSLLKSLQVFEPTFRGGLTLAVGDLAGTGTSQVVVGAGFGGGPRVSVWDAKANVIAQNYFAHDPSRRGGVEVAVTDLEVGGKLQVLTGAADGTPEVGVFNGNTAAKLALFPTGDSSVRVAAQAQANEAPSLRAMMASTPAADAIPTEGVRVRGGALLPGTGLRGVAATYFTSSDPGTERLIDLAPYLKASDLA